MVVETKVSHSLEKLNYFTNDYVKSLTKAGRLKAIQCVHVV